jgi:hypothetical protein
VREQRGAGRLISVEADVWWLPDTAATDYRQQHSKTTIVTVADGPVQQRLACFHNAGLYSLDGEDYRQTMANGGLPMPLYAERIDASRRHTRPGRELRQHASERLQQHLAWRPDDYPMRRFSARFAEDLSHLQHEPDHALALAHHHAWDFASTRQQGSAMERLALPLLWLDNPAWAGAAEYSPALAQCLQEPHPQRCTVSCYRQALARPGTAGRHDRRMGSHRKPRTALPAAETPWMASCPADSGPAPPAASPTSFPASRSSTFWKVMSSSSHRANSGI